MFCAKCGAEVSEEAHLCEKCKNTSQEEIIYDYESDYYDNE